MCLCVHIAPLYEEVLQNEYVCSYLSSYVASSRMIHAPIICHHLTEYCRSRSRSNHFGWSSSEGFEHFVSTDGKTQYRKTERRPVGWEITLNQEWKPWGLYHWVSTKFIKRSHSISAKWIRILRNKLRKRVENRRDKKTFIFTRNRYSD